MNFEYVCKQVTQKRTKVKILMGGDVLYLVFLDLSDEEIKALVTTYKVSSLKICFEEFLNLVGIEFYEYTLRADLEIEVG